MKLEYIKANGVYYKPQEGISDYPFFLGCSIKKLLFGRWQVDYYDNFYNKDSRIILYPSGIEEIKYLK